MSQQPSETSPIMAAETLKDEIVEYLTGLIREAIDILEVSEEQFIRFGRMAFGTYPNTLTQIVGQVNELWTGANTRLSEKETELGNLRQEHAKEQQTANGNLQRATSALEELRERIPALEQCKAELGPLKNARDAAEGSLQKAKSDLEMLAGKQAELEKHLVELTELKQRLTDLEKCKADLAALQHTQPGLEQCKVELTELQKKQPELEQCKVDLAALRQKQPALEKSKSDLAELQRAFDVERDARLNTEGDLRIANASILEANIKARQLEEEVEILSEISIVRQQQFEMANGKAYDFYDELARLRPQLIQARDAARHSQQAIARVGRVTTQNNQLEAAAAGDRQTIQNLQRQNDELSREVDRLKTQDQEKDNAYTALKREKDSLQGEFERQLQAQQDSFATERTSLDAKWRKAYDTLAEKFDNLWDVATRKRDRYHNELNVLRGQHQQALEAKNAERETALGAKEAEHTNTMRLNKLAIVWHLRTAHGKLLETKENLIEELEGTLDTFEDYCKTMQAERRVLDKDLAQKTKMIQGFEARAELIEQQTIVKMKDHIHFGHEEAFKIMAPSLEQLTKSITKQYTTILDKKVLLQKRSDEQRLQERTRELRDENDAMLKQHKAELADHAEQVEQQIQQRAQNEKDSLMVMHDAQLKEAEKRAKDRAAKAQAENADLKKKIQELEAEVARGKKRKSEEDALEESWKRQKGPEGSQRRTPAMDIASELPAEPAVVENDPLAGFFEELVWEAARAPEFEQAALPVGAPGQDGEVPDGDEGEQIQAEQADDDNGGETPQSKAQALRSMFYFAWNVQPDGEVSILAEFANNFSRGRSLESVVADVDKYCKPKLNKAWPPPCLNARIRSTGAGGGGTMTQATCPFCKRGNKICLFATFAPVLDGNTVEIDGQNVRWILKKRRATAKNPVDPEWRSIGGYIL